jgi:hypothetical protein
MQELAPEKMPFKFPPIMSQNTQLPKVSCILGGLLLGWNLYHYSLDK